MTTTVTPRPCAADCGRYVTGREKLCDDCVSWCECGRRKLSDRPRCRRCSARATAVTKKTAGRGERPLVWVKNRRGIFVARR